MINSAFNDMNIESQNSAVEQTKSDDYTINSLLLKSLTQSQKEKLKISQYFIKIYQQINNIELIKQVTIQILGNIELLGSQLPNAVQIVKQYFQITPSIRPQMIDILSQKIDSKATMLVLHIIKQLAAIQGSNTTKSIIYSQKIDKIKNNNSDIQQYVTKNWDILKNFYIKEQQFRFKEKIQFSPDIQPEIMSISLSQGLPQMIEISNEMKSQAYNMAIQQLNPFLDYQFQQQEDSNPKDSLKILINTSISLLEKEVKPIYINFLNIVILYYKQEITENQLNHIVHFLLQQYDQSNIIKSLVDCLLVQFFDDVFYKLVQNKLFEQYFMRIIQILFVVYYQFDIQISQQFASNYKKFIRPIIDDLMYLNDRPFMIFNKIMQTSYYFWEELCLQIFQQTNSYQKFKFESSNNIIISDFLNSLVSTDKKVVILEQQHDALHNQSYLQIQNINIVKEQYTVILQAIQTQEKAVQKLLENQLYTSQLQILEFIFYVIQINSPLINTLLSIIMNSSILCKMYDNIVLFQAKQRDYNSIQKVLQFYFQNQSNNIDQTINLNKYIELIERYYLYGWLMEIECLFLCKDINKDIQIHLINSILSYISQQYDLNVLEVVFTNKIQSCQIPYIAILGLYIVHYYIYQNKINIKDIQIYDVQTKYQTKPIVTDQYFKIVQIKKLSNFVKITAILLNSQTFTHQQAEYYQFIPYILAQISQIEVENGNSFEEPKYIRSTSTQKSKQFSIYKSKRPNQSFVSHFVQEYNQLHELKDKLNFLKTLLNEISQSPDIFKIDSEFCQFSLRLLKIETNSTIIEMFLQILNFIFQGNYSNKQVLIKSTIDDTIILLNSRKKNLIFYANQVCNSIISQETQLFQQDFVIKNNYFASAIIAAIKNTNLQNIMFGYIGQYVIPNIESQDAFFYNEFIKKIYKFAKDSVNYSQIVNEIERIFPQSKITSRPATPIKKILRSQIPVQVKSRPVTPVKKELRESQLLQKTIDSSQIQPETLSCSQLFNQRQTNNDIYSKKQPSELWEVLFQNNLATQQTNQELIAITNQATQNFTQFQHVLDIIILLIQNNITSIIIKPFIQLCKSIKISNLNYSTYLQQIILQTLLMVNESENESLDEFILSYSNFADLQFLIFSFSYFHEQKTIEILFDIGVKIMKNDVQIAQVLALTMLEKQCNKKLTRENIIQQCKIVLNLDRQDSYDNIFIEKSKDIFKLFNYQSSSEVDMFKLFPVLNEIDLSVSTIFKDLNDQLNLEFNSSQIQCTQNISENIDQNVECTQIQVLQSLCSDLLIGNEFIESIQQVSQQLTPIKQNYDIISQLVLKILLKVVKYYNILEEKYIIQILNNVDIYVDIRDVQMAFEILKFSQNDFPIINQILTKQISNLGLTQLIQPIIQFSISIYSQDEIQDIQYLKQLLLLTSMPPRILAMKTNDYSEIKSIFHLIIDQIPQLEDIDFQDKQYKIAIHPLSILKFIVQEFKFVYYSNEDQFEDFSDITIWLK